MLNRMMFTALFTLLLASFALGKDAAPIEISMAKGKVTFKAPKTWEKQKVRSRILAYEFSAPAAVKSQANGRMTVMAAGGSIKANLDRWVGQFTQPDGKSTKEVAKISEKKFNEQLVHLIDVSGNFADRRGPFAPAVQRKDFRMLGAIIPTEKYGQIFIKFYGPSQTVKKHEKDFTKMLETLKVAK